MFGVRWDHGKTCQLVYSPKQYVSVVCVRQTQAQVNKHDESHIDKECLLLRDEDPCWVGMGDGGRLKANE